jgi:hypothetical protein
MAPTPQLTPPNEDAKPPNETDDIESIGSDEDSEAENVELPCGLTVRELKLFKMLKKNYFATTKALF